jgi:hypothetical protein
MRKVSKEVKTHAFYENSFGMMGEPKEVVLNISVWIDDESAGFELYDVESGGHEFYGEGMLVIEDGVLYDYDGVFELSKEVIDILNEMNIDTTNI